MSIYLFNFLLNKHNKAMNQEEFQQQMKQWVLIDNQLKEWNAKIKTLREKRHFIEQNVTAYANSNHLDQKMFQLGETKLKITNAKVPEPITFRYLEKTLSEIIQNEEHVKSIMEHIKMKRNIKMVPEIKRFSSN